jgi:hypothetical protein
MKEASGSSNGCKGKSGVLSVYSLMSSNGAYRVFLLSRQLSRSLEIDT